MWMGIILLPCILGMIFCVIILYRNNLVRKVRNEALNIISNKVQKAIAKGEGDCNWPRFHEALDDPSYDSMLYNIRKWNFDDYLETIKNME